MVKFDLEGWVRTVTVPPQHSTKDKQSLGGFSQDRILGKQQRQAVRVGASGIIMS